MERVKQKIISYFKENSQEIEHLIIDLLSEMVQQRTVNVAEDKLADHPYLKIRGEEYRVGDIVKREFDQWEIPYQVHARHPQRPNIIGTLGKNENGKRLLVAGHMDIVPAGPESDWANGDPYQPVLKDGMLYGRGVLDNKGPLVSSMIGAKVLKEVVGDQALAGQLQIAALADEEAKGADGDYGIGYLLDNHLIDPTYAIIPDVGENMQKIDIAEKGRVVYLITAVGKQAHGSMPELGINAVLKMGKLLNLLEDYTPAHEPHPLLNHCTVNLGEIWGGAAPNIVPASCTISLDIRTVPGQSVDGIKTELLQLCQKVAPDFKVETQDATEPHTITPDNVLVKSIQQNCHEFYHYTPQTYGLGGGTYAKSLNEHGIIAVGFGPGDDTYFHVADEQVPLQQLKDFACLIAILALDLL